MPPQLSSKKKWLSLPKQIQISGLIAFLLFLAVILIGVIFFQQIQIQNRNFEVGTFFSDRGVSQLQRELLRLRNIVANPSLFDEDTYTLQIALVQSRLNILDDSLVRLQPTQNIQDRHDEITASWALLTPSLFSWQIIQSDTVVQAELLSQLDSIELLVNDMVRQYEVLRLERAQASQNAGELLGIMLGAVTLFFIFFVFGVIYNTYRFIQERALAEKQLAMYTAELERSNQELQQFAYAASHDLQEPLRKIRTFGERLQMRNEDKLDKRSVDYIVRMNNAATRMQTLIDDLLAFSRVATQAVLFVEIDMNKIVRDVVNDLETRIEEVGGQIDIEPLPIIEADPIQMQQLLQNLISNALKFHREDIPPVVQIHGAVVGKNGCKQLQLFVADNGIGMEAEYYDRVFELFQRLHGRTQYAGTGIGLAICRRITERHRGTINVQSQLNKGTTFIVTLPITQNSQTRISSP